MVGLESVVQFDNERMSDGLENLALRHGALCVLGVHNDRGLLENLHRIQSMRSNVSNQINLAIAGRTVNNQTMNDG